MKILKQITIILLLCLVSEGISILLPFAFPGSVIAIIITAILLLTKIIKEKEIKEASDFLLANMAIVFLPISVEIVEELGVLKGHMAGILIVAFISLFCTFFASYFTVVLVEKLMNKLRGGKNHE